MRFLSLSLLLFLAAASVHLVAAQSDGSACFLQMTCTGCVATSGCGWCVYGSIGACNVKGDTATNTCGASFPLVTTASSCPAPGNGGTINPPIGDIGGTNNGGGGTFGGSTFGGSSFAATQAQPSSARVNAAVAMLCICAFSAAVAMTAFSVGYNPFQHKLAERIHPQPNHFLSTQGGSLCVLAAEIALFALLLAGMAVDQCKCIAQ